MLQIIFESIPVLKIVSKVLKTWYFPYSAFRSTGQWGAYSLATLLIITTQLLLLLLLRRN